MQLPTQAYILLVEDSITDTRLFLSVLKLQGFTGQIEVLHDGREAMHFLSLSIPLPRAIIIDAGLPGMPGMEVLHHIKAQPRTCHIPVVIWSGAESPRDREVCERLPGVRYITKPFDLREWEQQIGQFMCEWAQVGVG